MSKLSEIASVNKQAASAATSSSAGTATSSAGTASSIAGMGAADVESALPQALQTAVLRESAPMSEGTVVKPSDAYVNDVSGAVAWARECCVAGRMRAWIDLPTLPNRTAGECDGMLWTASLVLLRHLEVSLPVGFWAGKRVLELGSGTGHLAVGLATLGALVTATESAHEMAGGQAGYDSMVAWTTHLLASRAVDAGISGGSVGFRQLHWGIDDLPPNEWSGFDVVILSELYFDPDLHEVLLQTLRRVLIPGMVAYSIFCDRPFSLGFLAMLDDDGSFDSRSIDPEETFHMEEDDVIYTHVITRKGAM